MTLTYALLIIALECAAVVGWAFWNDPDVRRIRCDRRFARHNRIRGAR